MLVKLISLDQRVNGDYILNEVMVNPKHIVMIKEEPSFRRRLKEGTLPSGIHSEARFSSVLLIESPYRREIVIVGTPAEIEAKIFQKSRQLLRG